MFVRAMAAIYFRIFSFASASVSCFLAIAPQRWLNLCRWLCCCCCWGFVGDYLWLWSFQHSCWDNEKGRKREGASKMGFEIVEWSQPDEIASIRCDLTIKEKRRAICLLDRLLPGLIGFHVAEHSNHIAKLAQVCRHWIWQGEYNPHCS